MDRFINGYHKAMPDRPQLPVDLLDITGMFIARRLLKRLIPDDRHLSAMEMWNPLEFLICWLN